MAITIKQAVINVCEQLQPGETLLGYELYNRTLAELRKHGSKKRPLSDTVLRRFREVREICNMESQISVSKYTKKE